MQHLCVKACFILSGIFIKLYVTYVYMYSRLSYLAVICSLFLFHSKFCNKKILKKQTLICARPYYDI